MPRPQGIKTVIFDLPDLPLKPKTTPPQGYRMLTPGETVTADCLELIGTEWLGVVRYGMRAQLWRVPTACRDANLSEFPTGCRFSQRSLLYYELFK